jgi:hypothetical protein
MEVFDISRGNDNAKFSSLITVMDEKNISTKG